MNKEKVTDEEARQYIENRNAARRRESPFGYMITALVIAVALGGAFYYGVSLLFD